MDGWEYEIVAQVPLRQSQHHAGGVAARAGDRSRSSHREADSVGSQPSPSACTTLALDGVLVGHW